jgi:BRCT domain type II-containing protein
MITTECRGKICFTGFKRERKAELKETAKQHCFIVRTGVTKKLDYLCCGYNAGPVKIEKAKEQGVRLIDENQFEQMIDNNTPAPFK